MLLLLNSTSAFNFYELDDKPEDPVTVAAAAAVAAIMTEFSFSSFIEVHHFKTTSTQKLARFTNMVSCKTV